jgi:rubrerythrin
LLSDSVKTKLLEYQRNEITEYHIYKRLAAMQQSAENARILERIADDEKRHYEEWKKLTRSVIGRRQNIQGGSPAPGLCVKILLHCLPFSLYLLY